ncbi:MAG: response regulator [Lachnospiraceae bacterium]|nr:response regulator [Lachnospiraceae bacterium]
MERDEALDSFSYNKLKKTLEELEEAKKREQEASLAKSRFLSQMSHEIRTPVNAILGYNELVLQDTGEVATREYAKKVKKSANRLMDFFDAVMDYVAGGGNDQASQVVPSLDMLSDDSDREKEAIVHVSSEKKMEISGAYGYRVLVVDDTEVNVDLLVRILSPTGLSVDTAEDGQRAITQVKKHHYDLIFMDHMMPIMDGIEALHEMRLNHMCDDTPVVMLTANAIEGEKEKYLNEGFAAYITKPFTEESIYDVLLRFLHLDATEMEIPEGFSSWEEIAERFPSIDTDTAKEYCIGKEEFFLNMIKSYVGENIDSRIKEFYSRKRWTQYIDTLYSLYDSSMIIGAADLAKKIKSFIEDFDELDSKSRSDIHESILTGFYNLCRELEAEDDRKESQNDTRPVVLVIDDESTIHILVEGILGTVFRVVCASSGEEGLILAKSIYPALILLDLKMPGTSGFDVLSDIKHDGRLSEIPVIFMTGDDDRNREVEGFNAGVSDFVYKPFPPEVLMHRVRRLVELSKLQKYLQHEVALQTEKASHLSREIMLALSAAVDAKDHYTNGHSKRVARYSADIARRMGKPRFEQEEIYVLGLMHDIGKIGVHEEIINKTTSLTDEEYNEMKKHTEIGYDILRQITEMPRLATGARWHHERYDGSGYPDGLKGEEIPEEARIICVADCYDAMTSKRSYSSPREQKEVRDEIVRCKGKQFDPHIADILIQMIDEDIDYRMSERGSRNESQ